MGLFGRSFFLVFAFIGAGILGPTAFDVLTGQAPSHTDAEWVQRILVVIVIAVVCGLFVAWLATKNLKSNKPDS